jgi:WD40 repeat protein
MMYDSEDFFSPERVDEQIELSPLLPAGPADAQKHVLLNPDPVLIHDLRSLFSAEGARNARSLQGVWQRLAQKRTDAQQESIDSPPAEPPYLRLLISRENETRRMIRRRNRHLATAGTPALAAVLFLALMVSSILTLAHFTRQARSSGVGGITAQATPPTRPTPGPDYPYLAPGQDIARSPASPDGFPALAWAPNGKRLVASTQGKVWLWDLSTGGFTPIFSASTPGEKIHALAWSPDGRYLAVGSNLIQVIDPASGREIWSYAADYPYLAVPGQHTHTTALAWSLDSRRLAMATLHVDKRCFVNIWSVYSIVPGRSFPDTHCAGGVSSLSWSSDDRYVASADGYSVQAWDAQSGYGIFQHAISGATSVSWSPGATSAGDLAFVDHGVSEIWNVWSGRLVNRYPSTSNGVLAWAPDGRYLATASGHTVTIYDVYSDLPVYTYSGQAHTIASLAWSPDGRDLASGEGGPQGNNTARVWSA